MANSAELTSSDTSREEEVPAIIEFYIKTSLLKEIDPLSIWVHHFTFQLNPISIFSDPKRKSLTIQSF